MLKSALAAGQPMGAVLLGGDAGVEHHLPDTADAAATAAAGEIAATGAAGRGQGHL